MCDFVCGTMSHAKLSLHRSIIHYQMTFVWLGKVYCYIFP